jgi:transcriptional regulator with XRE-family HTH domain
MKATELRRLIGWNVKRCRNRAALTQEMLSEKSGVAYKYLQEIEGGRANITVETLSKLTEVLDVHPLAFFQPQKVQK